MNARAPARTAHPPRAGRRPGPGFRTADLSASVTVFLIALPLSLGIALTAGAPLQAGLVAAAVGGIVGGRLGGVPLQVTGPAAGLTVVSADLIQLYGWRTTCALTVVSGLAQLALGFLRVARSALAVSPAIVHGMLAGIGVTLALAQLHIVLGGAPSSSPLANAAALPDQLSRLHPAALSVSVLTLVVLLAWPRLPSARRSGTTTRWFGGRLRPARLARAIPAPLAAVGMATAVTSLTGLRVPCVDLPSWRSHALPEAPHGPVLGLIAAVLTLTLVGGVQSLLSGVAVDRMTARRKGGDRIPRADLDRELRGLGVSNVVSGALGGLPVAGVAVRSTANAAAGAVSRNSAILHGVWIVLAAGLLAGVLGLIPLAALAALVMVVGIQMVSLTHIRSVTRHGEVPAFVATAAGVVLLGVLEGVAVGGAGAVGAALHRLTRTRITVTASGVPVDPPGEGGETAPAGTAGAAYRVLVNGQLTFLAVPRLSRALGQVPEGARVVVELNGSFLDHAAFETLQEWRDAYQSQGGTVRMAGRSGRQIAEPPTVHHCTPWTPWRNHQCTRARDHHPRDTARRGQLLGGVGNFQRNTAPLVREELARLAREGQRPSQLFLTCADSRVVTSMITSSGPGDLFTVRNVGNLVPPPGQESPDESVAAAIEYAVDVLAVESITICGHSGCGAIQALHSRGADGSTPLGRWLRHGHPSRERLTGRDGPAPRVADRDSDALERLCLANVVQQLEHLMAHGCVARRVAEGGLELHGMYFHVAEAQAYVLEATDGGIAHPAVFTPVRPGPTGPLPGPVGPWPGVSPCREPRSPSHAVDHREPLHP